MCKRIHGEDSDHSDIADELRGLGKTYGEMRDHEKAKIHLELALNMYTRLYGNDNQHPDIQNVKMYMSKYK